MSDPDNSERLEDVKHDVINHRTVIKELLNEIVPLPGEPPRALISVLMALSHNWSETNLWLGELVHELRARRMKG